MSEEGLGKRLQEEDKPINPFKFTEKGKPINPFIDVKSSINGPDRFAILRTTENGKYVRGNKLYFKLNGVELYTDINNIIFVDTVAKIFFVEPGDKVLEEIAPVDPKNKQYVILIKGYDSGDETYTWESITGRLETYNFIVDNIDMLGLDPKESFVLTDNVALKDALTVEQFIKHIQSIENLDDGFDIEEYVFED